MSEWNNYAMALDIKFPVILKNYHILITVLVFKPNKSVILIDNFVVVKFKLSV